MTNYLALNTAGDSCSVALSINGAYHQREDRSGQRQSRALPALVAQVLSDGGIRAAALDGVVCCIGPGAFASVRVGVAFAKGFALALDRPVAGVSSLALLAQHVAATHGAATVLSVLDARMGQVYTGLYATAPRIALHEGAVEGVCIPDNVPLASGTLQAPLIGCGNGWQRYREALLQRCPAPPDAVLADTAPQAVDAFALVCGAGVDGTAFTSAARLAPVYLRNHVALTLAERGKPKPTPA